MKRGLLLAAGIAAGIGLTVLTAACLPEPSPATSAPTPAPVPVDGGMVDPASIMAALETPCELEDSENCYWRADLRGNGEGTSFVNVEGHVFPLTTLLQG